MQLYMEEITKKIYFLENMLTIYGYIDNPAFNPNEI